MIDMLLKPLLKHIDSYVRDDIDFLNYIPNETTDDTIMVSFDVTSLYSSIPHDLGRRALEFWLDKHRHDIPNRFQNEFIIESILFILENNTFHFNDKHFIQKLGTAMGTKVAPTYANLVLAYLEDKLYTNVAHKYGQEFTALFRKEWKRYLDDCFIFWKTSVGDIEELFTILQNLHENIKFTMEKHDEALPFLDILIIKEGRSIKTDIYYKPTDTKQYLHFRSSHERHVKTNLPYSLARRICTIVIDPNLRRQRLSELQNLLKLRGFPKSLIDDGIERALSLDIKTLRTPKRKIRDSNVITFVSTHNPNNSEAFTTIKNNLPILRQCPKFDRFLNKHKLIKSKRQPNNLKKSLTRAKFSSSTNQASVKRCSDLRCGACKVIRTGSEINIRGSTFRVQSSMNCSSKNVIYMIFCNGCDKFYIGQTTNLRARVRVHKSQIKNPAYRFLPVSKHISECGKGKFEVYPLYQVHAKSNDDINSLLTTKENYFIKKFKPALNG